MTIETYKFYRDANEYTKGDNEMVVSIIKAHYPKIENPKSYSDEDVVELINKYTLDYFLIYSLMNQVNLVL